MSGFNGSGTFVISGVGLPYTSGSVISSTVANTLNNDLATGLSNTITKDGQSVVTANIPFYGYKITSLGTGASAGDAANVYNIQCSTGTLLTVSGNDTIVATAIPALSSSYATGMTFRFFAAGTNTGAVTLEINGQGAKAITKNGTVALSAGDIPVGVLVTVTYDGTRFVLANQTTFASVSVATLTVTGNASVGGNATVTGNAVITGNSSVGGTFSVTGKSVSSGGNVLSGGVTLLGTYQMATAGMTSNGIAFLKNQAAVSTTLNGTITSSATSITLTSVVGFPSSGTILIDNEQITYSVIVGNVLTVIARGANNTVAAAHTTGAAVSCGTFGTTTASSAFDNVVTSIPVVNTASFPDAGTLIIDNEQISYTSKTAGAFAGATRGVNGTTAASHALGATITGVQTVSTSANLKYDDVTGAMQVPNLSTVNLSTTNEVVTNLTATNATISNLTAAASTKIQPLDATYGTSVTFTLNPTILDFRSTTLTVGTVSTVAVSSAISCTVASGATLGTVNNVKSRIVVLAIYKSGVTSGVELAVVNLAGGVNLDETDLITTTALSGTSNSASTIYSTSARSGVAYKVVGFVDFTNVTAGTWATLTEIQGAGGQPNNSMSSLGFGQTYIYQTAGSAIVSGTTYYNQTGKPILINFWAAATAPGQSVSASVNGTTVLTAYAYSGSSYASGTIIIPANAYWSITWTTAAPQFYRLG